MVFFPLCTLRTAQYGADFRLITRHHWVSEGHKRQINALAPRHVDKLPSVGAKLYLRKRRLKGILLIRHVPRDWHPVTV